MGFAAPAAPDQVIRRQAALETGRAQFETQWQRIRNVLLPAMQSFQYEESPGTAREDLLDSSSMTAADRLASALDGMLTSPSTEWMALRDADMAAKPDYAGSKWLERSSEILLETFQSPQSGFGSSKHELFLEEVTYGTASLYVADRPGTLPLYQARPLDECYLTEGAEGMVDGVWRKFDMTARQAAERWDGRAGDKVLRAARDEQDRKFQFIHAVYPRRDAQHMRGLRPKTNLPFASVWVSVADKAVVDESGFHELPFMVPRWRTRPGEVYGRGCGADALADTNMLQGMAYVTLRAGELAIAPPLLVSDDGVLDVPNLRPAGMTTYRSGMYQNDPVKPLNLGGRPDIGLDLIEAWRANIEKVFFLDLLSVMQDPKMTATQIIKLDEETLRVLGPMVARIQSELLAPLIERTFNIALRAGALPPPPPSLQGREIRIEYLSPMARAARYGQVVAIGRTMELVSPISDRQPEVMDNFDLDATSRHIATVNGMPAHLMRDPDAVTERRDEREQRQAQQAQTEQMIEGAPGAAKLLEAAGKTGMMDRALAGMTPGGTA